MRESLRLTLLVALLLLTGPVEAEPVGTFYVWANLERLPEPLNDGMAFFQAGLAEKVITVPGLFFDVNPERRRSYGRARP